MARVVKMGSQKSIPEQDYTPRKKKDVKYNRNKLRANKVSQRETSEAL